MGFLEWSRKPARHVDATRSEVNVLRGLVTRATTPLLPDDYLQYVNPLWSARELRGRIESIRKETHDSATLTIRTGWGFPRHYHPGQYVGIGIAVDGRYHWRSYSLTSIADDGDRCITVTVKANPDGFLSSHLVDGLASGTMIRLAAPKGDFHLPEPLPEGLLFLTAGSGITPVMAMLRGLARRDHSASIVHVHTAPTRDDVIFSGELEELAAADPRYELDLRLTRESGRFDPADLDRDVPDWRERTCYACGPVAFLDDVERVYDDAGIRERLHIERFAIARTDTGGEGGEVTFARSGKTVTVDGATTLLEAGENEGIPMPFGCRMGICQTCVVSLDAGYTRDLRNGTEHREGDRIQTCVSTVSGACTLDL